MAPSKQMNKLQLTDLKNKRQMNNIERHKNYLTKLKNWLSASHTRARRVPTLFLVFVVIAATIIHHP